MDVDFYILDDLLVMVYYAGMGEYEYYVRDEFNPRDYFKFCVGMESKLSVDEAEAMYDYFANFQANSGIE